MHLLLCIAREKAGVVREEAACNKHLKSSPGFTGCFQVSGRVKKMWHGAMKLALSFGRVPVTVFVAPTTWILPRSGITKQRIRMTKEKQHIKLANKGKQRFYHVFFHFCFWLPNYFCDRENDNRELKRTSTLHFLHSQFFGIPSWFQNGIPYTIPEIHS